MTLPAYKPFYKQESTYHYTHITSKYMGYFVHRPVRPSGGDTTMVITERHVNRPDLLSFDVYGLEDVWWVIPVRNGLQDPVFDLKLGMTVVVPDPFEVRSLV